MRYQWKKGLANAGFIFLGVILAKMAPYLIAGDINPDAVPVSWLFWGHTLRSALIVTVFAEAKYLLRWLATYGGNGKAASSVTTVILLSVSAFLAGCPKIERDVYNTAIGGKAFIESLEAKHPECETGFTPLCDRLVKAAHAQRLLVEAGKVYCNNLEFEKGGACHPPQKGDEAYQVAIDKLRAALSEYESAEKDLKGAIK